MSVTQETDQLSEIIAYYLRVAKISPQDIKLEHQRLRMVLNEDCMIDLALAAATRLSHLTLVHSEIATTAAIDDLDKLDRLIEVCLFGQDHAIRGRIRSLKHELADCP